VLRCRCAFRAHRAALLPSDLWRLAGVASHLRYVERAEQVQLSGAGRTRRVEASCAALIDQKSAAGGS